MLLEIRNLLGEFGPRKIQNEGSLDDCHFNRAQAVI
jgi:hypothetical protein